MVSTGKDAAKALDVESAGVMTLDSTRLHEVGRHPVSRTDVSKYRKVR